MSQRTASPPLFDTARKAASPRRLRFLACVAAFVGALAHHCQAVTVQPDERDEAARWVAVKFQGIQQSPPAQAPALVVLANHDPVQKNARSGRPMRIVNSEFTRGLYCHAFSQVLVRLPEKGEGLVQAFRRAESFYEVARFKLRGLDPDARYVFNNLDSGESHTLNGRELLDQGLAVSVPEQPGDAVLTYTKVK